MGKSRWRKIVVDDAEFEWLVPGNRIDAGDTHIRVRARGAVGQPLLIDPYPWSFEVRPKSVADAIRWSLANGWQPVRQGTSKAPMLISIDERGHFHLLPEGVRFAHELPHPLGWTKG